MDPSLGPIPHSALPLVGGSSHVSGAQSGLVLTAARAGKALGGRGIFWKMAAVGGQEGWASQAVAIIKEHRFKRVGRPGNPEIGS